LIGPISIFGDASSVFLLGGDGKEVTTVAGNNIISDGDGGSVVSSGRSEVTERSLLGAGGTGAARAVVICASGI
jgi:hypothetical protein